MSYELLKQAKQHKKTILGSTLSPKAWELYKLANPKGCRLVFWYPPDQIDLNELSKRIDRIATKQQGLLDFFASRK